MIWHKIVNSWDGGVLFWSAMTHDGWEYRIRKDQDPYRPCFRIYVDKPRREGHNRSSASLGAGSSLIEAQYMAEKYDRKRLAKEAASEARIREAKARGKEFERKRIAEAQNSHQ